LKFAEKWGNWVRFAKIASSGQQPASSRNWGRFDETGMQVYRNTGIHVLVTLEIC
jgi:hypothetical protein